MIILLIFNVLVLKNGKQIIKQNILRIKHFCKFLRLNIVKQDVVFFQILFTFCLIMYVFYLITRFSSPQIPKSLQISPKRCRKMIDFVRNFFEKRRYKTCSAIIAHASASAKAW